jgi:hypothetical protein
MSISTYYNNPNIKAVSIQFDNNNNLYIADSTSNSIFKIDTNGNKTTFCSGFTNPIQKILFDNVGFPTGFLYVMDNTATKIYRVDNTGNRSNSNNITINAHNNSSFTLDGSNNVYYGYNSIVNFTPKSLIYKGQSGSFNKIIDTNTLNGNITLPLGLATDNSNNLYVCDGNLTLVNSRNNILKYNSSGTLIKKTFISSPAASSDGWYTLIVDNNNNIYAAYGPVNTGGKKLYKYDSSGNTIGIIYTDQTNSIIGLAFDTGKNLYFTTNNGNTIIQYTINPPLCFKENTMILTDNGYRMIQNLQVGSMIKTLKHNYMPISIISKRNIYHSSNNIMLYKCTTTNYPELFEDMIITKGHSILVEKYDDINMVERVLKINGGIFITDNMLRLPVGADNKAIPYEENGYHTIYHIALENEDDNTNYGIYANGLLVESCSLKELRDNSNMMQNIL